MMISNYPTMYVRYPPITPPPRNFLLGNPPHFFSREIFPTGLERPATYNFSAHETLLFQAVVVVLQHNNPTLT